MALEPVQSCGVPEAFTFFKIPLVETIEAFTFFKIPLVETIVKMYFITLVRGILPLGDLMLLLRPPLLSQQSWLPARRCHTLQTAA